MELDVTFGYDDQERPSSVVLLDWDDQFVTAFTPDEARRFAGGLCDMAQRIESGRVPSSRPLLRAVEECAAPEQDGRGGGL